MAMAFDAQAPFDARSPESSPFTVWSASIMALRIWSVRALRWPEHRDGHPHEDVVLRLRFDLYVELLNPQIHAPHHSVHERDLELDARRALLSSLPLLPPLPPATKWMSSCSSLPFAPEVEAM